MNSYKYTAKDKNGQPLNGIVEANTEIEAAEMLHSQGYIVLTVVQQSISRPLQSQAGGKIKPDDLVIFSRQLATMIDSGIPLVQSLGILAEQVDNKSLRSTVAIVHKDIEAGMNFCDALAKHPAVFSELFINMVRAGEASGMLDEVLERLAGYQEKSAALNRKISSSLVYPSVVITMAFLITLVLLIKVVPTFQGIFDMLGGTLPLPTQILIAVSVMVRKFFMVLLCGAVGGVFLFRRYINTEKGRYSFDAFKLKAVVFGPLFTKVAIARFARTFATLVKSGVSILNALEIVGKTAGNKVVEETVSNCRTAVRNGEPISRPLAKSGVFPIMVCRMIGVGEQTGQLEKMLNKIADFYDEQVDVAVSAMTSMIEPMVIAFLGVVIGAVVISLFLPVFKITELVTK